MGGADSTCDESESKRAKVSMAINPYLKKPEEASVAKQPAEDLFTSITSAALSPASLSVPPAAAQHVQEEEEETTTKPAAVEPVTSIAPNQEKQTFGHKDSAVERLPSRNVSFGSAEILTVSELQKNASHYVDHSVRVTGVVLHRHVSNDGNVCLVLKDPSIQQQQKPKTAAPKSILKTPGTTRTGGGGIKRRLSSRGSTPRFVTRKRPFSTLKKAPPPPVNPIESMVTSLVNQQTVLVYAVTKQMPVNEASLGDLVMIIGQVKTTTAPVPAVADILEQWNAKTSSGTTTNSFVHARILRNVNGTDMRLHDEALRMRRQYLIQSNNNAQRQSNDGETDASALLPGCGPPPYYDESDSNKEMNV